MAGHIPANELPGVCFKANKGDYASFLRLCREEFTLEQSRHFKIEEIGRKHKGTMGLRTVSEIVLEKVKKLEEIESVRTQSDGTSTKKNAIKNPPSPLLSPMRPKPAKQPCVVQQNLTKTANDLQKSNGVRDVSKYKNLQEMDFHWVRPALVQLKARELKDFLDKNPKLEAIADSLFRRHVQADFPDDLSRKEPQRSWRTLHDALVNWREYNKYMANGQKY